MLVHAHRIESIYLLIYWTPIEPYSYKIYFIILYLNVFHSILLMSWNEVFFTIYFQNMDKWFLGFCCAILFISVISGRLCVCLRIFVSYNKWIYLFFKCFPFNFFVWIYLKKICMLSISLVLSHTLSRFIYLYSRIKNKCEKYVLIYIVR